MNQVMEAEHCRIMLEGTIEGIENQGGDAMNIEIDSAAQEVFSFTTAINTGALGGMVAVGCIYKDYVPPGFVECMKQTPHTFVETLHPVTLRWAWTPNGSDNFQSFELVGKGRECPEDACALCCCMAIADDDVSVLPPPTADTHAGNDVRR